MGRAADLQKTQVCATHYMHNSPVARGLVAQPGNWPWSRRSGAILLPGGQFRFGDGSDAVNRGGGRSHRHTRGADIQGNVCATRDDLAPTKRTALRWPYAAKRVVSGWPVIRPQQARLAHNAGPIWSIRGKSFRRACADPRPALAGGLRLPGEAAGVGISQCPKERTSRRDNVITSHICGNGVLSGDRRPHRTGSAPAGRQGPIDCSLGPARRRSASTVPFSHSAQLCYDSEDSYKCLYSGRGTCEGSDCERMGG
jgi:hypothetical protein